MSVRAANLPDPAGCLGLLGGICPLTTAVCTGNGGFTKRQDTLNFPSVTFWYQCMQGDGKRDASPSIWRYRHIYIHFFFPRSITILPPPVCNSAQRGETLYSSKEKRKKHCLLSYSLSSQNHPSKGNSFPPEPIGAQRASQVN